MSGLVKRRLKVQITNISKDGISSFVLPEKVNGCYWVKNKNNERTVSIESSSQKWVLKSNKKYTLIDEGNVETKNITIEVLNVYQILERATGNISYVFVEPITSNRANYTKYGVVENTVLSIGKTVGNDIVFNSPFVSKNHAVLSYQYGKWTIEDRASLNGTYVNDYPVSKVLLNPGDVVYIMGMKIIIGDDFFAVNDPDEEVRVNTEKVGIFEKLDFIKNEEGYELEEPEYFYRSPRFRRGIETAKIKVDNPPSNQVGEEMPMMLVLGPSITMGMASVTMTVFSINNAITSGKISSAIPSIAMSVSMMLGTMLWPILTKRYDKKKRHKKEEKRQEKYSEYLKTKEEEIEKAIRHQEEILNENSVTITECKERIHAVGRKLWEGTINQKDFLELRLGLGTKKLDAEIHFSERHFTLDEDNLNEEMLELCERPKILKNIPITISLLEKYIAGVIGSENEVNNFIKGLILQLTALYSKEDVKLVFLYDESQNDVYEFVKWLPHVWDNDMTYRFIATNDEEIKDVSVYFERTINNRLEMNENECKGITPYYVVFVLDKNIGVSTEFVKKLLSQNQNLNISMIFGCRELKELPKECSVVIELSGSDGKLYDKNNISDTVCVFRPDISISEDITDICKELANIPLDLSSGGANLPDVISFLSMYDVGKVEHLNVLERWKDSNPAKNLEAYVGVDTNGKLFKLDLHEKYHGPHGLVAGMTGSGKSEFIITYILSMAINYHPDEVAFILIDYKGGGMAKSFENLPHTAGIITNLDGSAIKRSLVSIQSELKRRQAIFVEVSKETGVSNIDIYKYQKLRREGKVHEPLQHLFIIADEFAELKTQQPDFMEQLVSAARIGRSLGVHLILATQKPSGVVDDQIWSNSKFRVCLKVQERSDSMDMLKRPDAAELKHTGRFYLQVGYNELFEIGQSAWAGANYYPSESVIVEKNDSVDIISRTGRIISQVKPVNANYSTDTKKQMDAITQHLSVVAEEENIKVRALWLPPLPSELLLEDLIKKYAVKRKMYYLNPPIGEYDDPYQQKQDILTVPFAEEGNALVFGLAGSGKTTFITTMLYSLISNYTPAEVEIYIMDFASETLRAFEKAPHVGDIMFAEDEDKISRFFGIMAETIKERKKLFSDFGGDYGTYIEESGNTLPNIVIVVNNYAAVIETYDALENEFTNLSRECTKYGIYIVLTVPNSNTVRYRMVQNFGQVFTMQLSDESDYTSVIGKTDGLYPAKVKGRGLFRKDEVYEFQTALVTIHDNLYRTIQDYCISLSKVSEIPKKGIKTVPDRVELSELMTFVDEISDCIPIGFDMETAEVYKYPIKTKYISLFTGNEEHIFAYMPMLLKLLRNKKVDIIDIEGKLKEVSEKDNIVGVEACSQFIKKLFALTLSRFESITANPEASFDEKVILVYGISKLRDLLESDDRDRVDLILENGSIDLNMHFILTDSAAELSNVAFELWYRNHLGNNNGIWIGDGVMGQTRIQIENKKNELEKGLNQNRAYVITNGIATPVKIPKLRKEDVVNE